MKERERIPPDDEALDRALAEALAVEPSPEFVAKLRSSLANQPHRRNHVGAWQAAAAACVVAGVGAALFLRSGKQPDEATMDPAPLAARTPARALALEPAPVTESGPVRRTTPPTTRAAASPTRPASALVLSEVVISEAEKRGFQLLLAELQRGTLPPVRGDEASEADSIGPAAIHVEAIVMETIPPFDPLEGESR